MRELIKASDYKIHDIIQDYINSKNMSFYKFCKICNISYKSFYNIMLGRNVRFSIIERISKSLNISLNELLLLKKDCQQYID